MLTMAEAKAAGAKAAGQEFECERSAYLGGGPTGAIGTILAEPSARGKLQAELTCCEPGCTGTHNREVSDWHQSRFCELHQKHKSKGTGAGTGLAFGRQVKLPDGQIIKEMKILETDDDELKGLKATNNEIFAVLFAEQEKVREAEKVAAKAKREADQVKAQLEKAAAVRAEIKAKAQASLAIAQKLADERGVAVSASLVAMAEKS